MAYYRVEARVIDYVDEYVQAKSKEEAIEKAQDIVGNFIEDITVIRITRQEYEDYS